MFSSSNTANSKMPHRSLKTMESRMVVTGYRGFLREEPHERRRELQDIPRTFEKAQFWNAMGERSAPSLSQEDRDPSFKPVKTLAYFSQAW